MGTSGELNVALVALVISLIALVVTTVQLLTQLFGTADGTRRCSTSVLGEWGKLTRWHWRWSEGRFETIYTVPEILLGEAPATALGGGVIRMFNPGYTSGILAESEDEKHNELSRGFYSDKSRHWFAGPDPALEKLIVRSDKIVGDNDLAGWISFLQVLDRSADYALQPLDQTGSAYNILCWPYLVFRERSWDFMPPDVVRPLAVTNISDLAIMVRRLGLIWKDFDPKNGQMTAEGGPHVISSVIVRGVGLVLQYKHTNRNISIDHAASMKKLVGKRKLGSQDMVDLKNRQINIWTTDMDKILFGILPGNHDLGLPDFCIATPEDCLDVLEELNEWNKTLKDKLKKEAWFRTYEFNDLIPMAAPIFRQRGTVDQKTPLKHYWACLFTFKPAFIGFSKCLQDFNDANEGGTVQTQWVLKEHQYQQPSWGSSYDEPSPFINLLARLEYLHNMYDRTTVYFQGLENREKSPIKYYDLLKAHFSKAPLASIEARSRYGRGQARTHPDYKGGHAWRIEHMYLYFEYIPDYVKFMEEKGCHDRMLISEAWITLIFRALCWQKLHKIVDLEGATIPTEYYASQLPVYLG